MQIYKGEQCLYSTLSSEIPLDIHTLSKNKTKAKIIPLRSKQYIVVAGHLPEQYDEYIIAYCKDIQISLDSGKIRFCTYLLHQLYLRVF